MWCVLCLVMDVVCMLGCVGVLIECGVDYLWWIVCGVLCVVFVCCCWLDGCVDCYYW